MNNNLKINSKYRVKYNNKYSKLSNTYYYNGQVGILKQLHKYPTNEEIAILDFNNTDSLGVAIFKDCLELVEEEFVLPKNWCVLVTEESRPYIYKYRQSIDYRPYEIPREYPYQSKEGGIEKTYEHTVISLEQFKKYLLKEETIKTLVLGSGRTKITISKNCIIAEDRKIFINDLQSLLTPRISSISTIAAQDWSVELLDAKYKIGCSKFTLDEIKLMVDTYKQINN